MEKIKKLNLVIVIITLIIGGVLGILLQKYFGVGNIFTLFGKIDEVKSRTNASQTITKDTIPYEHQGKMQLFILAGQSNMVGKGDIPVSQSTNPRIYVFGNDYHWKLAIEPIDDPLNQVDNISENKAGFSPATSFASIVLLHNPNLIIGLIPCAMDSSSILEWQRNLSENSLYGSCLKRVRAASVMGEVAGILFFQGETDSLDQKYTDQTLSPDRWAEDFSQFVNDWRTDLDSPNLPVIFAQIGTIQNFDRYPNWTIVQEQQLSVRIPYSRMVTTSDLLLGDGVHFTTKSYQIIGKRFAEAYLSVVQEP